MSLYYYTTVVFTLEVCGSSYQPVPCLHSSPKSGSMYMPCLSSCVATFTSLWRPHVVCCSLKMVLMILSQGSRPWLYFTGKDAGFNCYDFLVVILSLAFIS